MSHQRYTDSIGIVYWGSGVVGGIQEANDDAASEGSIFSKKNRIIKVFSVPQQICMYLYVAV